MNNRSDNSVPRLLYQTDSYFNELYERGLEVTGTPEAKRRRERFYNLVQFFLAAFEVDGLIAECGCWRGLSSYILCHYLQREAPRFAGKDYHIFDSFMGLSRPSSADALSETIVAELTRIFGRVEGAYAASLEQVKAALGDFPDIEYHQGWIPQVFDGLPESRYKFVHIDVDLYEPTRASIEYFYPRLAAGGLIVCDDYGSVFWPGAKMAIDDYCIGSGLPLIRLSTGQAVIWKGRATVQHRSSRVVASLRRSLADAQMDLSRFQTMQVVADEKVKTELQDLTTRLAEAEARARALQSAKRHAEREKQLRPSDETTKPKSGSDD